MEEKSFEDMTFDERVKWGHRLVFGALVDGGTQGMRQAVWTLSNMWARYPLKRS